MREWITPDYIAGGGPSHGTAMTMAAAEGLTADHALIYGMGLDPRTLHAAMTRDRETARLYLPRELLETDADRARHGRVRGEADALQRALAAYAATLDSDRVDRLLTPEPEPIAQEDQDARPPDPAAIERAADGRREDRRRAGRRHAERGRGGRERESREAAAASLDEARAAIQLASARLSLSRSAYGVGLLTDKLLTERINALTEHHAQHDRAHLRALGRPRRHQHRCWRRPASRGPPITAPIAPGRIRSGQRPQSLLTKGFGVRSRFSSRSCVSAETLDSGHDPFLVIAAGGHGGAVSMADDALGIDEDVA